MRDERAQTHAAVRRLDARETLHVAQAHQAAGLNQALSHHRHERGAPRDDARVVSALLKDREDFVERPRRAILEGVHERAIRAAAWIDSTIL